MSVANLWARVERCQDQDAPSITQLWARTHVARKAGRVCSVCKDPIEQGQKYESMGHIVDGVFEYDTVHWAAYHYPSGCPRLNAQDRAEAEAQLEKDRSLFA